MEICKHGIVKEWCALCNPPKPKRPRRQPKEQERTTVHGAGVIHQQELFQSEWVIVQVWRKRNNFNLARLSERTKLVHIDGHPFVWLIKEILKRAPKLETIQVTPTMGQKISDSTRKMCAKRNVCFRTGYWRPEYAWEEGENRSPFYVAPRAFLMSLEGEQKELFDELLALGFASAEMTSRYFCLKGEEFISQRALGEEFGFSGMGAASKVSAWVNGVIHYLDPEFEVGQDSSRRARNLKQRVRRIRRLLARTTIEKERLANEQQRLAMLAKTIGVTELPEGLPLARLDIFEALVKAKNDGSLEELKKRRSKAHLVIVLRFGLEDGKYKTLQEVAGLLGGLTRERIRQLEEQGLAILNIPTDEE